MTHPLNQPGAMRVVEHRLVDVCDAMKADSFSLVEDQVTFVRRPRGGRAGRRWTAALGDWCVPDGTEWQVVSDDVEPVAAPARSEAEAQVHPQMT